MNKIIIHMSQYKDYIQEKYLNNKIQIINKFIKQNKKKHLFLSHFNSIYIENCINNNNYLLYFKYKYPNANLIYIGFVQLNNNKLKINIYKNHFINYIYIYNYIYKNLSDINYLL